MDLPDLTPEERATIALNLAELAGITVRLSEQILEASRIVFPDREGSGLTIADLAEMGPSYDGPVPDAYKVPEAEPEGLVGVPANYGIERVETEVLAEPDSSHADRWAVEIDNYFARIHQADSSPVILAALQKALPAFAASVIRDTQHALAHHIRLMGFNGVEFDRAELVISIRDAIAEVVQKHTLPPR